MSRVAAALKRIRENEPIQAISLYDVAHAAFCDGFERGLLECETPEAIVRALIEHCDTIYAEQRAGLERDLAEDETPG